MSELYDSKPLAIEVRALVNRATGEPHFTWLTITTDSIEAVSRASTKTGGGASIRLKSGAVLLVSNSYEDVSTTIVGDARRFPSCEATEAEMLEPPSAEDLQKLVEARKQAAADAGPPDDVGELLRGLADDEPEPEEDLYEDELDLDDVDLFDPFEVTEDDARREMEGQ